MTPKEAWQKICPMALNEALAGRSCRCVAYGCAVWEVLKTEEIINQLDRPKGSGKTWRNTIVSPTIWRRPISIDEQPGQCGLITKG